jgi:hypothetical protein
MVEKYEVFDAIRRGYNDLENSSNDEIYDYFQEIELESLSHHVSHIKGILFEQEYVQKLDMEGIDAEMFEATNHPLTDIAIFENGEIVNELQLKATESVSYINATLAENPDIMIVATTEVANAIDSDMVIDSGISEAVLEDTILESISPIPFSPIGIGIGLLTGFFF